MDNLPLPAKPKLREIPEFADGIWTFSGLDNELEILLQNTNKHEAEAFFYAINGETTIDELSSIASDIGIDGDVQNLLNALNDNFLLDDRLVEKYTSGVEAIFEIEDVLNELLYQKLYKNKFWTACHDDSEANSVSDTVLFGMIVENWYFLHNESFFDAPILAINTPEKVRSILLDFFNEEHKHDDLVLQALTSIGLDKNTLIRTIPLPQTTAVISALTHWARTDPLLFLSTLNVLEGGDMETDSYIKRMIAQNLPESFIDPVKSHSEINIGHGHGNITRLIFQEYECLNREEIDRIKAQLPLFIDLYSEFFNGVLDYYSGFECIGDALKDRVVD